MDNSLLRQVEAMLGDEARAAFDSQDAGDDVGWSGYLGSILETLGSLTDHLARVVGALPHDRHYVREKAAVLTRLAIMLESYLMFPAAVCNATTIAVRSEPDGDGGVSEYTLEVACGLGPGHYGEHELTDRRTTVIGVVEDVALHAAALARSARWMLADEADVADVREQFDGLRQELDRLDRDLRRVPSLAWL